MKAHTGCVSNKTQEPFVDRHEALCVCTDGNTTCTKRHWKSSYEDGATWSRSAILLRGFRVLKANPKANYRGVDLDHIVPHSRASTQAPQKIAALNTQNYKVYKSMVFARQMPWMLLLEHQTQCTSGNHQARMPLLTKASRYADEHTENDKESAA